MLHLTPKQGSLLACYARNLNTAAKCLNLPDKMSVLLSQVSKAVMAACYPCQSCSCNFGHKYDFIRMSPSSPLSGIIVTLTSSSLSVHNLSFSLAFLPACPVFSQVPYRTTTSRGIAQQLLAQLFCFLRPFSALICHTGEVCRTLQFLACALEHRYLVLI